METTPSLLDQAPETAARILALTVLDEATAASRRLGDEKDTEALHDFRVALRRCRTLLKSYRPLLADSVSKKQRRMLGELARSTTGARDTEVQLAWLRDQEKHLRPVDRAAWTWLVGKLEKRGRDAYDAVRGELLSRFNRLEPRLRRSLSRYVTTVDQPASTRAFSTTAGELVGNAGDELRAALNLVTSPADVEEAHEARILAKRLRYVLEPLRRTEVGEDAAGLVKTMKGLQEILGELHDAHVLASEVASALVESVSERALHLHEALYTDASGEKDKARQRDLRSGLLAIDRLIRDRVHALYQTLSEQWLGEHFDPFRSRLNAFAEALSARATRHVEIERKYLLRSLPKLDGHTKVVEISQGWIPGSSIRERLRRSVSQEKTRFFRTIKVGAGIQRLELEDETESAVFEKLWPLTDGHRVHKRRYKVPVGNLVWEIDEFLDRKLFLAEIELPAVDAAVEIPSWLAPHLVREVTGEAEYVNENLGK
jgi:CHAD domain-containing protein/CYTH domain-containing protein